MRHNDLSLLQELVRHANAFTQQTAGILAQIKDQSLQLALLLQLIQRLCDFVLGRFLEARYVDVSNTRANHEVHINAVARNLVTHHVKVDRLVRAFAQNSDLDGRALGPFEQVGDVARAHVVGRLAVNRDDDVARPNAGPVRGRSRKRSDHDDFVIARSNLHAHAVVLAALLFAQGGVRLRVKEIRVRIEYPQHPGNRAVINGLVGIDRLGVVLLHHLVNLGEAFNAVANVGVIRRRRGGHALAKDHADTATGQDDANNQYGGATGTAGHYLFLREGRKLNVMV